MLIIMIVPTKSMRFLTDNFQRIRYRDLSICACCKFLYELGQGLGAGSGIRDWVRVRANMYICGDVKDEAFGYNCLSSRN